MHRIDLTRAEKEPLVFERRLDVPAREDSVDVVSVGRLELSGVVEKSNRGFHLQGEVRGEARLRCVRCLCEFPFALSEGFELRLLPASAAPREDDTRLAAADLAVRFYDAPELDLTELAVEQVELALPMKPLCSESCQGLCPHCGRDRNQGRCTCPTNADERWAPLLGWRPRK